MATSQAPTVQPDVEAKEAVQTPNPLPAPYLALIDEHVKSAFKNGFLPFAQNAGGIDRSFDRIQKILEQALPMRVKEWKTLHARYQVQFSESQKLAESCSNVVLEFTYILTLVPNNNKEEVGELIEALKAAVEHSEEVVRASGHRAEKFDKLRSDIIDFVKSTGMTGPYPDPIEVLRRKIRELLELRKSVEGKILKLCEEIGLHYIITGLVSTIPEVAWRAAQISTPDHVIKETMQKLEYEYIGIQTTLDLTRKELEKLEDESTIFDPAKAVLQIQRLCDVPASVYLDTLNMFGIFPGGSSRDCAEIIKYLEDPEHVEYPAIMMAFSRNQSTIYDDIADAAVNYATGRNTEPVDPSSVNS